MLELKTTTGKLLEILNILNAIGDEVRFNITETGITSTIVDPANVALASVEILSEYFDEYKAEEMMIGIDLIKITTNLSAANKNEPVTIQYDSINEKLNVKTGNYNYNFSLLDPKPIRQIQVPQISMDATAEVPVQEIQKIIKVLSKLDEITVVNISKEKKEISFTSSSTTDTAQGTITNEIMTKLPTGNAKTTYSLDYLADIFKAIKTETVSIEMDTDKPIKIGVNLSPSATVSFMLAPRIEN
jgi:proliferating cell nuclear antigen